MDRKIPFIALAMSWLICAKQPQIYLFSHGLLATGNQVYGYIKNEKNPTKRFIITPPFVTFNFPDAFEPLFGIPFLKFWNASFGQDNDVKQMVKAYNYTVRKFPEGSLILVGISRGASVALAFTALYKAPEIRALVLESPFDTIQASLDAALNHIPAILQYVPGIRKISATLIRLLAMKYNPSALQPIDLVEKIPLSMPILIISSREDKLVPASSSFNLYQKLKDTGHSQVHLLELSLGRHSRLLHANDGDLYQAAVNAFYKKYGLEYDPVLAKNGENLIK